MLNQSGQDLLVIMNPHIHRIANSDSGDPQLLDGETIELSTQLVSFDIGNNLFGPGRVLVSNQRMMFVPDSVSEDVVVFNYRSIALHAISARDEKKCIFIQLMSSSNSGDESDADDDVNENNENLIEMFPVNENDVSKIFVKMNDMAALHPDISEDDEGDYDDAHYEGDAGDGSVPE